MSKTTLIAAVAAIALAVGGAYVMFPEPTPETVTLKPDDPAVVAQGRAIYVAECASCHGADLEGEPNWRQRKPTGRLPAPPHDETGHTWHHPDRALFELTKYGPGIVAGPDYETDMPAYENKLDDAEIVAVLSYIKSTWPDRARAVHDEINRRARAE